jgi:hypothetical protein
MVALLPEVPEEEAPQREECRAEEAESVEPVVALARSVEAEPAAARLAEAVVEAVAVAVAVPPTF